MCLDIFLDCFRYQAKACRSKLRKLNLQPASFVFQAHPPLPGLPAGLKAWPIMGVLVVWVWVCAVYWRNKAGGIAVRRRRRSSEAGKDGLGVAGSGSDAVGGTTGRLRSVCVPQRSSLPLAVNAITTVYYYIFPSVWTSQ